ncbi:uncharacterized protein BDZ99DRAFT_278769 [Mytilinidion resinicola]|uniref:Secreted protein n=1 Tax=Mytilinidion resinicola TaxID=574789 RepID=A0A6A6YS84_9PEZI|nr:uncharacterized protein BDZ99DRAFT_278769 [Mytilinidion resinicola]KAF2811660.1 hypothetical protein BDZ99DRAFT_278769 [Mytilinidion resinicola]
MQCRTLVRCTLLFQFGVAQYIFSNRNDLSFLLFQTLLRPTPLQPAWSANPVESLKSIERPQAAPRTCTKTSAVALSKYIIPSHTSTSPARCRRTINNCGTAQTTDRPECYQRPSGLPIGTLPGRRADP